MPSSLGAIDAPSMKSAKSPVMTRPVQSIAGVFMALPRVGLVGTHLLDARGPGISTAVQRSWRTGAGQLLAPSFVRPWARYDAAPHVARCRRTMKGRHSDAPPAA